MRFLALALIGLAIGCGSVLNSPDGGAGGGPCVVNGVTYPPGGAVPSGDCNTCTCAGGGAVSCTLIACPPDAGTCGFDTTYRYGNTGGLVAYENQATLAPPHSYTYNRSSRITDPADISCSPLMPPCGSDDVFSPQDVMRAIADADVQKALATSTPPTYGRDARPVDGTIFQFLRADGHGFLAGDPCGVTTGPGGCIEVPAGIARLVSLLRALDEQQLKDASCAALR